MTRLITLMTVSLIAIATMAQNSTGIEVSYTALSPNFRDGQVDIRNFKEL